MSLEFDYFYGAEAEQFTFFRIPKVLFKDKRFKDMSTDAKLLYGLMLDRMGLSMRNRWIDDDNRVYIIYKMEEIIEDIGCARQKVAKLLEELDKSVGLIERKRQGLTKKELSEEEFLELKQKIESSIAEYEKELESYIVNDLSDADEVTINLFEDFLDTETFTNEMLRCLIKTIYVYDDRRIEIKWNFKEKVV